MVLFILIIVFMLGIIVFYLINIKNKDDEDKTKVIPTPKEIVDEIVISPEKIEVIPTPPTKKSKRKYKKRKTNESI